MVTCNFGLFGHGDEGLAIETVRVFQNLICCVLEQAHQGAEIVITKKLLQLTCLVWNNTQPWNHLHETHSFCLPLHPIIPENTISSPLCHQTHYSYAAYSI